MTRVVYYAAMSLDGYIAEPEEKLTWLMGFEGQDYAGEGAVPMEGTYDTFMEGIGALVLGSKTYEFVRNEDYWPYTQPAWVLTNRDLEPFEGKDIRFASGPVTGIHADTVAAAGDKDVWLIGGGDVASQYIDEGLLDELILTVVPVILGDGLPLFARAVPDTLRLTGTRPFDTGMVELRYEVERVS
jgi:dihydrofolate reductase